MYHPILAPPRGFYPPAVHLDLHGRPTATSSHPSHAGFHGGFASAGMMGPGPGPGPVMTTLPTLQAVDRRCAELVGESVVAGRCGSLHGVLQGCLASWPGVTHLGQLGIQSVSNVPTLMYLWRMEQLLDSFVTCFVAMRAVATLRDLEQEAVIMLRSFGMEQFDGLQRHVQAHVDPSEILLDTVGSAVPTGAGGGKAATPSPTPPTAAAAAPPPPVASGDDKYGGQLFFDSFGIGPFRGLASVVRYFGPPPSTGGPATSDLPGATEVITALLEFQRSHHGKGPTGGSSWQGGGVARAGQRQTVDVAAFTEFLNARYGVADIRQQLGVRLQQQVVHSAAISPGRPSSAAPAVEPSCSRGRTGISSTSDIYHGSDETMRVPAGPFGMDGSCGGGVGLERELQAVEHVRRKERELLVDVQKQLLRSAQNRVAAGVPNGAAPRAGRAAAARCEAPVAAGAAAASTREDCAPPHHPPPTDATTGILPPPLPVLKQPSRPAIARFLGSCTAKWDKGHSPTFTALARIVSQVLSCAAASAGVSSALSGKQCSGGAGGGVAGGGSARRKRRRVSGNTGGGGAAAAAAGMSPYDGATGGTGAPMDVVVEIATEYAMLHLGGSRYRTKRWIVPDATSGPVLPREPSPSDAVVVVEEEDMHEDGRGLGDREGATHPPPNGSEDAAKVTEGSVEETKTDSGGEEEEEEEDGEGGNGSSTSSTSTSSTSSTSTSSSSDDEDGGDGDDAELGSGGKRDQTVVRKRDRAPFECRLPHLLSRAGCVKHIANRDLAGCLPHVTPLSAGRRHGNYAVGRWGEALVYQYLLREYPDWNVTWLNEAKETKASYDIQLTRGTSGNARSTTIFIEVKTTRYPDNNVFELSLPEWEFLEPGINYHIYRVFGALDPRNARVAVVTDPLLLLREHKIHLCLAI